MFILIDNIKNYINFNFFNIFKKCLKWFKMIYSQS